VTRERYVLLGLAPGRADWFRTLGRWANAAVLPAEFIRCVSAEELRARLRSSRPFSAALVDASVPGLDRDLIGAASAVGTTVLVVDGARDRDWRALGAAAVLAPAFSRDELLEVLAATAAPVGAAVLEDLAPQRELCATIAPLVAVTGPGGTGASSVAIALAQGLAAGDGGAVIPVRHTIDDVDARRDVLLADLCLVADQAMLHDSGVLVPGLQEVVEAHRTAVPTAEQLSEQTFEVPARGYRLLLGLRRRRHWVSLRASALAATLDSLQRSADVVVADVEADVEGEAECGSPEVEDRNLLARATLARADVAVVVGDPSMKGLYALVRTLGDLVGFGVAAERVLPVLSGSPRSPRARAELTATLAELLNASVGAAGPGIGPPLHLPVRDVDTALRDGTALPAPLPRATARAVASRLALGADRVAVAEPEPVPLRPGELSVWSDERPAS
jgi:hypothetical protein